MPKNTFVRLKSKKKEQIVESLINVFNRLGYDQVTVADIVKEANIPRGSFYQYFEDKYDAFVFLIYELQQVKLSYLEPSIKKIGTEPFMDVFMEMVHAGIKFARDHERYASIGMQLYKASDSQVMSLWKSLEKMGVQMMTEMITKDQDAGYTKQDIDAEIVAKQLYRFNSMEVLEEFYQGASDERLCSIIEKYMKIIRYGIEKEDNDEKESI